MLDSITLITISIATISLAISVFSFLLNYFESKPKIEFSECHISKWGGNGVIIYMILKNSGNKSIEIRNVMILSFERMKNVFSSIHYRDPVFIEKYRSYKLEFELDKNTWEERYTNLSRIDIVIDTTFGKFKKTLKPNDNRSSFR
jgi:hypothetical protein